MDIPDFSSIAKHGGRIVENIGHEAVSVYSFLRREYRRKPVATNHVFRFMYWSAFRLDNAGLSDEFKDAYFQLMDDCRNHAKVDVQRLVSQLHSIPNKKGQLSLQFSFATKLAAIVKPSYPIYDKEVANVFHFRAPYTYLGFEKRLERYMAFYEILRDVYSEIIRQGKLIEVRDQVRSAYGVNHSQLSDVKVLDFIFWSAGKLNLKADRLI